MHRTANLASVTNLQKIPDEQRQEPELDSGLIFDLGLHKGEDSEFYLKKGFRVVAVEALSKLCHTASERLKSYVESGQLVIVNAAIAESDGPITFYENQKLSLWGTTRPAVARAFADLGAGSTEITVEGLTFSSLLRRFGIPYYMKIDIEGSDVLCLESLLQFKAKPKFISIESNKTSWSELLREFELLTALGYSRFKLFNQRNIWQSRCPCPSREGTYIDHRFEYGSTGLFGDETPGPWLTQGEILKQYKRVFLQYRLFGDRGLFTHFELARKFMRFANLGVGWYDTHAALPEK